MDVLGFTAEPDDECNGAHRLLPVVNGTPLTALISAFEVAQGFDPAGGYDGVAVGPSNRNEWARGLTDRPVMFRQPHRRERNYGEFGPFEFDLSTYRVAVADALED